MKLLSSMDVSAVWTAPRLPPPRGGENQISSLLDRARSLPQRAVALLMLPFTPSKAPHGALLRWLMMQLKVVRSPVRWGALNQLVSKVCESSETGKSGKVNQALIAGLRVDKYHNLKDFLGCGLTLAVARTRGDIRNHWPAFRLVFSTHTGFFSAIYR